MRRLFAFALPAILALLAAALPAADFGAVFTFGNIGFAWDRTSAIPAPSTHDPLVFQYGGNAQVVQSVSENISLEAHYALDATERSKLTALFRYASGVVDVAIGPAFGVFNSLDSPLRAGFASELKVSLPGLLFVSFRSDSSLGSSLSAIGDNYQEFTDIRLGWYARNAICSLQLSGKKYQVQAAADLVTTDAQNDYALLVDIYKKGQPYNILMNFGYRAVSKSYASSTAETKDSLGAVLLGGQLSLHPARWLDIVLGLEGSVYTFAFDDLIGRGPPRNAFLMGARVGFQVDTELFWDYRHRPSSVDPASSAEPSKSVEDPAPPAPEVEESPADGGEAPIDSGVDAGDAEDGDSGDLGEE